MNPVNIQSISTDQIITHYIGNKFNGEELRLSDIASVVKDHSHDYLIQYLFKPIQWEEYYSFGSGSKLEQHSLYARIKEIFENETSIIENSKKIAHYLYECSDHAQIKSGELNIALFDRLEYEGNNIKAIGLYKSQEHKPFIKMDEQENNYLLSHKLGYPLKGVDKACLILNIESENGYRIFIYDAIGKSQDAKYWKDEFLNIEPCINEYHSTAAVMNMTRSFITDQLEEDFEVSKTDKIDLMNRSSEYFKKNDQFVMEDFEDKILGDTDVIESFREFGKQDENYEKLVLQDSFDISPTAVKKNTKVFKSVLKLDKNFHVYVHGNRKLIEQGVDEDGRKYYKLYYQEEN